jgi:hypothetical protein
MKKLFTAAAVFFTLSGTGQIIYSGGAGLSLTSVSAPNLFGEAGFRVGVLYVGAQVNARQSNYPGLSVGSLIGAAHSWNNNKMHELTTIFYVKADYPIIASIGYKDDKPTPFGFGIRHYVYNFLVDVSWQHRQLQYAIGYSIRNIYR